MLNKLKLNPSNPRIIGKKEFIRLKEKIRNFPEMLEKRPIVYDEDFVVLGGNQRLRVLNELVKEGFKTKDSYFQSANGWTEKQKREFVILDNIADGEWDYDMLANEWDDLPLEKWGIDGVNLNLALVEDEEVDLERLFVLTVEAPEAPKLKERMAFYCEKIEDYEEIKKFFNKGKVELNVEKLLSLIKNDEIF